MPPKPTQDSDSDDEPVDQLYYKVVILGDGAVGKTSIISRFCQDGFSQSYKQTIGIDFFNKKVVLPGNITVTLQIWDIGGQQIGGKMLGKYIYGANALLFVYDLTNPDSFKNVDDWLDFARIQFKGAAKPPAMALVGNKYDLLHQRQVKHDKHTSYATSNHLTPFVVSARTGEKVNQMFMRVAAELAGVSLTRGDLDATEKIQTASIVDHPSGFRQVNAPKGPPKKEEESDCVML